LLIQFGSGRSSLQDQLDGFVLNGSQVSLADFLNTTSLGTIPKAGNTIFIKYRIGGGKLSNLGVGVITQVESVDFQISGPDRNINQGVQSSLKVTNLTAAIGGDDMPSIEEVRNMITYNFSAQNRAVTLNDYKALIKAMPAYFGAPAKVGVYEEENKVVVKLLSYTPDGKLTNTVSNTLRENIAAYLSNYRALNDYVVIEAAEVVDLGVQVDVVLDKKENSSSIIRQIITEVTDYFSTDGRQMGDPLLLGDLHREIGNIAGVSNVVNLTVFNLIGGDYSSAQVAQPYVDATTGEIQQIDNTIYFTPSQIYQIRKPNTDIKVRVKQMSKINFE
jgi:hypothetical protein